MFNIAPARELQKILLNSNHAVTIKLKRVILNNDDNQRAQNFSVDSHCSGFFVETLHPTNREFKTTQFSRLKPVALKTVPSCFVVIDFFLLQLSTEHTCVDFTLRRIFPVAKMSPYIPFKIADWYTPGNYASYAP